MINVQPVPFERIVAMREEFRAEAGCQIVRDSILARGLADAFVVHDGGEAAGYGGVWNSHWPGRIMEFHVRDAWRDRRDLLFRALIEATGATRIEAQTNLPAMHSLMEAYGRDIEDENWLFGEPHAGSRSMPGALLIDVSPLGPTELARPATAEFVLQANGKAVARGGYLGHYNPPFVDVYVEVEPKYRRRGYGAFFVQETIVAALSAGWSPAARCDVQNEASRRTLLRGGFRSIGVLRSGAVKLP